MRTYLVESAPQYGSYHFPYAQMAEIEAGEDLTVVYAQGYLPASGDTSEARLLFYRARSLRLDLRELHFDKKRRYLQRRGTDAGLTWRTVALEEFLQSPPLNWKRTLIEWVEARHSPPFMDAQRLNFILGRSFLKQVAVIHHKDEWVGLVLMPRSAQCAHFWFSLYDSECLPNHSLGKWILGETAMRMQALDCQHLYLGTVYGEKSRYKFQGIATGTEFFDGNGWTRDVRELQRRMAADPA